MRRVTISIPEDVDMVFRKFASQKFRFERGWYSVAVNDAMKLWIDQAKSENGYLSNIHESWLNQGIKFIPQDLLIQIGDLNCLELIEAEYSDLSKTHEIVLRVMLNAKKIKGVSPIFHLDYIRTFNKILENGVNAELILTETVLRKTIEYSMENLEHLRRLISKNQLKIWEIKEDVKAALTVTDKDMTLGLLTMNRIYDVDRLLLRGHDDALHWGDKLFEHYLKRAKEVDLEYFEKLSNHIF